MSDAFETNAASLPELPLEYETAQGITDDLYRAYDLMDAALAHSLRLSASMIETSKDIGLDARSSQRLYRTMAACADNMVKSRGDLVLAHQQAHSIRMRTSQAETRMQGCPFGISTETKPSLSLVA